MCKTRKCPAMTLGVFASLTLLFGIAMVVLAIRFSTSGFAKDVKALGNYSNAAFYMLLAGAIIAIITGLCGIWLCAKKVKIWCNMIVGLFFMISFLLLFVNGIAIAFVSHTPVETLQKFCNEPSANQNYIVKALREVIDEVDNQIVGLASREMCSSNCPCPDVANKATWTSLAKTDLDKYERTLAWHFDAATGGFTSFTDCIDYMVTNEALYAAATT